MNNKVVSSITTDTGVLYQKKVNTQLSIDVPLNLTYSDEFSITGTLSSNGVGVVGATANLLVGSTVVDFTTTTTNGAYSFNNTPVSAGNHSFQVVFNGNSEYFASESTIVNRVVAKETSVLLNVTQTGKIGFASTGTGYNSVTPACILRTDDDEAIAYATIHFGDAIDSTQIDGYAQGNDVTYPTTSLNIVYEGDSNYTPSSVLASFEYQIPTLLNLSGTNIISKDETTTISGVLYDQDGDIIPNCQLEYNIKHNNTIITSGTVRTDNNGAITLNYTGTGIGDVDITVSYGRLLQETYEVIDSIYSHSDEISYTSTYSSGDHSIIMDNTPTVDLPTNCEITFKVKSTIPGSRFGLFHTISSSTCSWGFGESNDGSVMGAVYRTTSTNGWGTNESGINNYHSFKFVKNGNNVTAYVDDIDKGTQTFTWIDEYSDYQFVWWVWRTGTMTVKDLLIKAL